MALKFRRGSTADKSGSLSFGEPYVNSTLGTLQVGGASGDITLATVGDNSAINVLSVSASSFVSASNLHITNNAEIKGNLVLGGNITIGDQTSDTVAVNANLSSSIIPSISSEFDLGSPTRAWRDLYISTGSIKFVNPTTNTVVGTLSSNAGGDFNVSGEVSGSTIAGLGNAQQYSSSVNSRLDSIQTTTASLTGRVNALETKSASLEESFHTYSGSINAYTASNNTTNNTQNSRLNAIESTSASLNTYTASNDSTNAGQDARLSSLETTSGSLLTFSSSVANAIELTGSNVTIKGNFLVKGTTTTIDSTTVDIGDNIIELNGTGATNGGLIVRDATGGTTISGSLFWDTTNDVWKAGAVGTEDKILLAQEFYIFTASNDSTNNTQNNRLSSLETASGSIRSDFNSFTSSNAGTNASQSLRIDALETSSGSLNSYTASQDSKNTALFTATSSLNSYTASNTTNISAIHTSTGSLNSYTASNTTNINAIHTSTASLNTFTSSINTTIKSKLDAEGVISGSSQIDGTQIVNNTISIAGQSTALGSTISAATIGNAIGAFSGSAQITTLPSVDTDDLTEGTTNKYYTDARVKTKLSAEGVISGSSQVFSGISGDVVIASNGVATIQANSVALGTDTTGDYVASLVAGTNITLTNNSGEGATPTIALTNNSITIAGQSTSLGGTITAATIGNAIGAFSGSSQIDHNSTTNYSANEHVDHTAVSITAGSGLTGGGDISTTRTISIATGGVTNSMLANSTISGISLGSNLATLTIGTGLSGTSYNGSSAVTIANSGVTSNVAGTGISVSGATGAVTITNTGVTSAVAGTGVSVSGATGAVTISIGQAVATSSNVQFNSLGIGMVASATAGRIDATNDIVAFSSSDIRFKENIKPIENAIDKIRKISGNTYDWKEENKIEHGYEGNDVGVIAQEIEAVLPQLVQTRESGYKAVKYDKLVALLIEGIKEQQLQIEQLRIDLDNCRNKGL